MKNIISPLIAAALVACGKSEPVEKSSERAPTETVETLAVNPERLKALRQQCKLERAKLGDELCNRVAEATSRRSLATAKRPTRRRRNDPNSNPERHTTRTVLFCSIRRSAPTLAVFLFASSPHELMHHQASLSR